ncbi:hypothetical protein G6F24_017992 [Rhizopus arrhizus]|nr:hypothetical protein G6F24_017992 [Rhizopus arrhizus]
MGRRRVAGGRARLAGPTHVRRVVCAIGQPGGIDPVVAGLPPADDAGRSRLRQLGLARAVPDQCRPAGGGLFHPRWRQ